MCVGEDAEDISIRLNHGMSTEVQVGRDLLGTLEFASSTPATVLTGQVSIGRDLLGNLEIEHQVAGTDPDPALVIGGNLTGRVAIVGNLQRHLEVQGDVDSASALPPISVGQDLTAQIRVYGSLYDNPNANIEIQIGEMNPSGTAAIAIDYDGWHDGDDWKRGAQVRVGTQDPYGENTPAMHIWEIQPCKGDMNNNEGLDSQDPDVLWHVVNDPEYGYSEEFPGLEGSLYWHGDLDCSGEIDAVDVGALAFFAGDLENTCCQSDPECAQYEACRADLNRSGQVNLPDLGVLLAAYGSQEGEPNYNPDADFDANGRVELYDLSFLLGVYGEPCDCFASQPEGFAPEGAGFGAPPPIQVWFQAIDTGGYSSGGFHGEVDHFVFDLKVEVNDPNNDWTATGAVLPARNAATFRLSTSPTTPDEYATFVGAPWTTIPSGPGATQMIGAYQPPDLTYEFETTGINIGWYDTVDSENGPAAVMRLVIDVSAVEGADTSGGFGSVYFSQTGPANPEDILVTDAQSDTGHCFGGCDMHSLNGNFYVKGE